jgi:flavorubredoxin
MVPYKLAENIYWVGAIDWNLRNFHGYLTQRGSTYNAYLIIDEKITLVDTVKSHFSEEMIERISAIIDPAKIDIIIANHVEMDHSGSLPRILEICPNAKIYSSVAGVQGLKEHYKKDWNFMPVKTGDTLSLGKKTVKFFETKMVHWPDNMVSYLEEDQILFSNDAFGQHISSTERTDSEFPFDITIKEAKKYYANIVLPFGSQVQKAIQALSGLDFKIIAPSHGIIWKEHIKDILKSYTEWMMNETKEKALVIYDTMWGSTEKIALSLVDYFESQKISVKLFNLQSSHMSDIMTEIIDAKYICLGSPTLNNNLLPTVSAFLTYMKGLAPKGRTGLAFGSYGWGGQSVGQIEDTFKELGFKVLPQIRLKFIPDKKDIDLNIEKLQNELKLINKGELNGNI